MVSYRPCPYPNPNPEPKRNPNPTQIRILHRLEVGISHWESATPRRSQHSTCGLQPSCCGLLGVRARSVRLATWAVGFFARCPWTNPVKTHARVMMHSGGFPGTSSPDHTYYCIACMHPICMYSIHGMHTTRRHFEIRWQRGQWCEQTLPRDTQYPRIQLNLTSPG